MMSNIALTDHRSRRQRRAGLRLIPRMPAIRGAFDALLALQSMVGEDTVTEVSAQLAGVLEGAELPGSLDDSEDSLDDEGDASPDDALSFLAALLPHAACRTPRQPTLSASVPIQNDALPASAGDARLPAAPAAGADVADDLSQAMSFNAGWRWRGFEGGSR